MAACVPDDAIFVRLTFHRTNRRISDKSRFRRNLQSNRRRDRNPNARIRTGPQTNNDFFWRTEFLADVLQVYKKWSGILPIVCPFAHDKIRSEEHTSELQSRGHLVCRLLLEKKKQNI